MAYPRPLNRRGNSSTPSIFHRKSSTFTSTHSRGKTNVNIGTFVTTTSKATTANKPTPTDLDNMMEQ